MNYNPIKIDCKNRVYTNDGVSFYIEIKNKSFKSLKIFFPEGEFDDKNVWNAIPEISNDSIQMNFDYNQLSPEQIVFSRKDIEAGTGMNYINLYGKQKKIIHSKIKVPNDIKKLNIFD